VSPPIAFKCGASCAAGRSDDCDNEFAGPP
jgi:hypothetical protein